MMVDCAVQLPRPPPIPVVFDRVQDLLAVAVEKLRRNKLPRVILDRDEPTFFAAKTTGTVTSSGLWAIVHGEIHWDVLLSVCIISEYRRGAAGRIRVQPLLE